MAPYVFLCNDSKTVQADFTVFSSPHFHLYCSKDSSASVVHGAADLQDDHHQQVQEETRAAHGLPEDVSVKDSAAAAHAVVSSYVPLPLPTALASFMASGVISQLFLTLLLYFLYAVTGLVL